MPSIGSNRPRRSESSRGDEERGREHQPACWSGRPCEHDPHSDPTKTDRGPRGSQQHRICRGSAHRTPAGPTTAPSSTRSTSSSSTRAGSWPFKISRPQLGQSAAAPACRVSFSAHQRHRRHQRWRSTVEQRCPRSPPGTKEQTAGKAGVVEKAHLGYAPGAGRNCPRLGEKRRRILAGCKPLLNGRPLVGVDAIV